MPAITDKTAKAAVCKLLSLNPKGITWDKIQAILASTLSHSKDEIRIAKDERQSAMTDRLRAVEARDTAKDELQAERQARQSLQLNNEITLQAVEDTLKTFTDAMPKNATDLVVGVELSMYTGDGNTRREAALFVESRPRRSQGHLMMGLPASIVEYGPRTYLARDSSRAGLAVALKNVFAPKGEEPKEKTEEED